MAHFKVKDFRSIVEIIVVCLVGLWGSSEGMELVPLGDYTRFSAILAGILGGVIAIAFFMATIVLICRIFTGRTPKLPYWELGLLGIVTAIGGSVLSVT